MIAKKLTNGTYIRDTRIISNDNIGSVDFVEPMRYRAGKVRVWLESGQPLIMDAFEIIDVVEL